MMNYKTLKQGRRLFLSLVLALTALSDVRVAVWGAPIHQVAACVNQIGGVVFSDYNANGVRDTLEPGVAGVTVTAYAASGSSISAVTSVTGTFSLSVLDGTQARVEFANLPAGAFSGPHGPDSVTTVAFPVSPNCNVSLGVSRPGDYFDAR